MSRLTAFFLMCTFTMTFLVTGCWDRQEIEERTSVVAMALDKSKEKGLLRLSIQIPIPKQIAGSGAGKGGGGGMEAVRVMSSTGHTLAQASRNLQKRLNQELFYGHTRIVAVSEELAREGLDTVIDSLRRTPQIRRLLWPVVVKGDALKLLQTNPKLEQIPMMYLMDLMNNNSRNEIIPDVTLGTFFINLSDETREPGMNIVEATPDEMKWVGLAVFEETRMIGQLNTTEVYTLQQIRDEKMGGVIDVPCEGEKNDKKISFRPKTINTKKEILKQQGEMVAQVHVRLEGDIMESQCKIDFTKQENIKQVQRRFEVEMETRAQELQKRLQTEFKQDLLGFGTIVRAMHPKWWDSKKWEQEFERMKLEVHYNVLIRRTGMELK